MKITTNLRVLKKTRRKPEVGDIFAFQVEQVADRFFFGRVIATDATFGGISDFNAVLIYLYRVSSTDKTIIPPLRPTELLVPPIGTNTLPWTRGFFELVRTGANGSHDVLPEHCFRNSRGEYFDERGNRLRGPVDPVGDYGLAGIGAIDLEIGKALGVQPS